MKITWMENKSKLSLENKPKLSFWKKKKVLLLTIIVIHWLNVLCSHIPLICKPLAITHKVNEASPLRLSVWLLGSRSSAAPLYMHLLSAVRDNTKKQILLMSQISAHIHCKRMKPYRKNKGKMKVPLPPHLQLLPENLSPTRLKHVTIEVYTHILKLNECTHHSVPQSASLSTSFLAVLQIRTDMWLLLNGHIVCEATHCFSKSPLLMTFRLLKGF